MVFNLATILVFMFTKGFISNLFNKVRVIPNPHPICMYNNALTFNHSALTLFINDHFEL